MKEWWQEQGYCAATDLGHGVWCCVANMAYTWRLMVCTEPPMGGVQQFWCYPKERTDLREVIDWMMEFAATGAQGDPHVGWIKHHPSERRPRQGGNMTTGTDLIAAERQRQIEVIGWTPEHDYEHSNDELLRAATCYIGAASKVATEGRDVEDLVERIWPWERSAWHPDPDPKRNLAKAGALIAAELDRLST